MAVQMAMDWHEGEKKMHRLMRVPEHDNPTNSMLTPNAARSLTQYPLIAIGTLDAEKMPWTTVWGGAPGLGQPLGNSIIGVKTIVDRKNDPVVDILFGANPDGEVVKEEGDGRMIGGLTIDLETRRRQKLYGRMVAGAVAAVQLEDDQDDSEPQSDEPETAHQVQLVCRIDQSLGNCPKYLNKKTIRPARVSSTLVSDAPEVSEDAVNLIRKADLFFVSSCQSEYDMDTNHRGGHPGFVRVRKGPTGVSELYWPEYSGNRLYQTLGNLESTPRAGIFFPDFETGDALYLTGTTEVLVGSDAAKILPRSNLAVKFTTAGARFIRKGLPFRGTVGEASPYNPKVRPLASEASIVVGEDKTKDTNTATLMSKEQITPTIYRYKFSLSNPGGWTAGQWAALDFSGDLDMGYSHMRDDDPTSINDDFVRTFTISSPPAPNTDITDDTFEITARTVGNVTQHLSKQRGNGGFEIPIRGFGGEVKITMEDGAITPFVAGGVGITPLLAQLPDLDLDRLYVFWTLHVGDIALALDILERQPEVAKTFRIFLTGSQDEISDQVNEGIKKIRASGASCWSRRLLKEDLDVPDTSNQWHLCVSTRLRQSLEAWLVGKTLISEDFNF